MDAPSSEYGTLSSEEVEARLSVYLQCLGMSIQNEDPRCVFANLRAIRASLNTTGHSDAFHVYVLSDTRDPEIWAAEEWAWARMRSSPEGQNLFYRRRTENTDRKSGNIREFYGWRHSWRNAGCRTCRAILPGAAKSSATISSKPP